MTCYEFQCGHCGETWEFETREPWAGAHLRSDGGECPGGVWKRRYSANVVWPENQRGH